MSELEISVGILVVLATALGILLYRRGARQRTVAIAAAVFPSRPKAAVRRHAAKLAGLWGGGLAAFVSVAVVLSFNDLRIYGPGTGIPGAIFLVYVLELVTGRDFTYLAARWDRMSPGRKLLLGGLIVVVAAVVILGTMGIMVGRLARPGRE